MVSLRLWDLLLVWHKKLRNIKKIIYRILKDRAIVQMIQKVTCTFNIIYPQLTI